MQGQYDKQLDSIKAAIEDLHRTELVDDDTQRALLSLRGLAEEQSLYVDMFNKGHLSERAFRQMLLTLRLQIDAVRNRGAYQDVSPHRSALHRLEDAAPRWSHRVVLLTPLAARLQWQRIAMDYEMTGARFQSSKRVLDMLDTLARVEATPRSIVDTLRYQYQRKYETAQRALDQIAEHFPDLITDMQERLARRLLLVTEAEALRSKPSMARCPHR